MSSSRQGVLRHVKMPPSLFRVADVDKTLHIRRQRDAARTKRARPAKA